MCLYAEVTIMYIYLHWRVHIFHLSPNLMFVVHSTPFSTVVRSVPEHFSLFKWKKNRPWTVSRGCCVLISATPYFLFCSRALFRTSLILAVHLSLYTCMIKYFSFPIFRLFFKYQRYHSSPKCMRKNTPQAELSQRDCTVLYQCTEPNWIHYRDIRLFYMKIQEY